MKINRTFLEERLGLSVEVFEEIDSTNLYAKRKIDAGSFCPDLVIAEAQTNGQGRVGRSFYSPAFTGVYLTFCLKDACLPEDLTARVALATARAIDFVFSCLSGVKWVNDIYLNDRKIAGILCQKVKNVTLVGIGINVEKPHKIPQELLNRFGWITDFCSDTTYNALILSLHRELLQVLTEEHSTVLQEYRDRCVHLNRNVTIEQNGAELTGMCLNIGDDFSLGVSIDGIMHRFTSGFMSIKITSEKTNAPH